MKHFTLNGLFMTVVFMLFCCLPIHADDDLITEQVTIKLDKAGTLGPLEKVCGYRSTIKILFCPFIKLNNG